MKSPPLKHVVAFLVASVTALFARAWLQIRLMDAGYDQSYASDVSYLVVPPILLLLLFPVLLKDHELIRSKFCLSDLSVKVILCSVGIGILIRIAWHGFVLARAMLSVGTGGATAGADFSVHYQCSALHPILLSILISALIIPVIEEVTHRGYVQASLQRYGPVVAIGLSTSVFVVFHTQSNWVFVALGSIVMGTCYWLTESLWAPVIVHATANLVPHITLRCLIVHWGSNVPEHFAQSIAVYSSFLILIAVICLTALIIALGRRRDLAAPASPGSQRVGDSLDDV